MSGGVALPLPPPPPRRRALGPGTAAALGTSVVVGALVARPVPVVVPVVLVVASAVARRPALLLVAGLLAASLSGARAREGLRPPEEGPVNGIVTLLGDPESRWGETEVVARLHGHHVLLVADGRSGEVVAARLAGEHLAVEGRIAPLPWAERWRRDHHVVARLEVRVARPGPAAALPWRVANRVRTVVDDGAQVLGPDDRSLFAGLLFGDDRDQSAAMVDDFRGSGLSHLLAVSGQNVAYVLTLAAPLLRRCRPGPRLAVLAGVLGLFALVTRVEPSVLRAVAMAAGAAFAAVRGRPTSGLHLLGLAVAGLVLVDPLLPRQLGFQLSVVATAGIVVLGPRIERVLPGPQVLRAPLAVSAAAQVATAPLLIGTFGPVPVVSLPANLVAEPVAGAVMVWGLPVGVVAGLAPPALGWWAHRPTVVALGGLRLVAATAASLPTGGLGGSGLVAVVAAGVLGGLAVTSGRVAVGRGAFAVVLALLLAPTWGLRHPPPAVEVAPGVTAWRRGGATIVEVAGGSRDGDVLAGLRTGGVAVIDLLVIDAGARAIEREELVRHRARVGATWVLEPGQPTREAVVGPWRVTVDSGAACVAPVDGRAGLCIVPDPVEALGRGG